MTRLFCFLLACFCFQLVSAQGWTYWHNIPTNDSLYQGSFNSLHRIPGVGYLAAGNSSGSGTLSSPLAVRVDESGSMVSENALWNFSLSGFTEAVPTSDGGIVGHYWENYPDARKIIKLDSAGDTVWVQAIGYNADDPEYEGQLHQSSDGQLTLNFNESQNGLFGHHLRLVRFDQSGAILLDSLYTGMPTGIHSRTCLATDKGLFQTGLIRSLANSGMEQPFLNRFDSTGGLLWTVNTSPLVPLASSQASHDIRPTSDTGAVVVYSTPISSNNTLDLVQTSVTRFDAQGDTTWSLVLPQYSHFKGMYHDSLGTLVMTNNGRFVKYNGNIVWEIGPAGNLQNVLLVPKIDGFGDDITYNGGPKNIVRGNDGSILIAGALRRDDMAPVLVKLDSTNSSALSFISGIAFRDDNADCIAQPSEVRLQNMAILANGQPVGFTNPQGAYFCSVPAGNLAITLSSPASNWVQLWDFVCPSNPDSHFVNISFQQSDTVQGLDFALAPNVACPFLQVDVSSPVLRRCDTATYTVQYCNYGTLAADSSYIEIELDSTLTLTAASTLFFIQSDGSYRFELDSLLVGECGSFTFDAAILCDSANPGRIHCVTAHIYPDSLCVPAHPNWSGASLAVTGQCVNGDSVRFTIENVGTANMLSGTGVWVVEDDILRLSSTVQLNVGQDTSFAVVANGSTWATLVDQVPNHPGPSLPRAIVEACGTNSMGGISLGYAGNFAEDDLPPYISIDCQEDVAAYDPNDKQGFPQGMGAEHEIFASDEIEYTIRFQNTGNDTAFRVLLADRIPETLDLNSIVLGAGSHPYTANVQDGNRLEFVFDPIELPDSGTNLAASQGFVRFNIRQSPGLPVGTHIENEAQIYFDYNLPILTNQTWHTLRGPYEMVPTSTEPTRHGAPKVTAFPSPFSESVTFRLEQVKGKAIRFELFDLSGKMVRSLQRNNTGQFEVERNGLPAGMYLYRIFIDGNRVDSGKVLVQEH